jgi:PatG C-terminal
MRGPIAPPQLCNGLLVPIVTFDQLYSFDIDALIQAIPRPEQIPDDQFAPAAEELFMRIMQMADNAGATDEHRALNYLAVRYDSIYALAAERHGQNHSLTGVEVRPSRLSGVRKIVDVIFSYTHRQTDVTEKYFVRVDVTEEFPFLVTRLSPFYDR